MGISDLSAVAVIDSVPTFRRGLEAALESAQFEVAKPANLRTWFRTASKAAVLITLRSPLDTQLLQELHNTQPSMPVVAVLTTAEHAAFREAIGMGAHAAVSWDVEPEDIVGVVEAALRGRSLLPTDVLRSLVLGVDMESQITAEERDWLDHLAQGIRVTDLARLAGYSEREMHRLLQRLYHRLATKSRSEALVKATRLGLLKS